MKIEGTVTISIEQYEELKRAAEQKEAAEREVQNTRHELSKLISSVDDEEYKRRIQAIDENPNLTEKQISKLCTEAAMTLRVVISEIHLRNIVHKYIDDEQSEAHYDLSKLKKSEFAKIPMLLEQEKQEAGE